jgi:hypothetical protein
VSLTLCPQTKHYQAPLIGWFVESRLSLHGAKARLKSKLSIISKFCPGTCLVNGEPQIGMLGKTHHPMLVIRAALNAREAQVVS